MVTRTEELYLEAEADIRNNNFTEAFSKYEQIIYEDPGFAPAHNSIGWMFKTQFDNLAKAELHFRAAIKLDKNYAHSYFHLSSLLLDLERFDELEIFLEDCLQINAVDKSWVFHRFGVMNELKHQYGDAIEYYKKALLGSLYNEKIKEYQSDIERCEIKLSIVKPKSRPWFNFVRK